MRYRQQIIGRTRQLEQIYTRARAAMNSLALRRWQRTGFVIRPRLPNENKRVLCPDQYCSRYIVGTCGKGEVSTGTNHLGFRCVKDKVDKRADACTTKVLLAKPFVLKESPNEITSNY